MRYISSSLVHLVPSLDMMLDMDGGIMVKGGWIDGWMKASGD